MKRLLLLSFAVNLLLAGLAWSLVSRRPAAALAPVSSGGPAARRVVVTNTASFHWRQVESLYYPVYIANLRAIGCPEPTINDIITADLKSVFDARRSVARTRAVSPEEAASRASSLEREEQEARRLLLPPGGQPPAQTSESGANAASPRHSAESLSHEELLAYFTQRDATDGQTKLMYADINPTDMELRQLYDLSMRFNEEFGQNPSASADANWEKRRRLALRQMDDQLRSLIGYPRYNEYLREAVSRGETFP